MQNKNILITGGLGFIGTWLVKELYENNNIYVLDNLFTGTKENKIPSVKYYIDETINIFDLFQKIKIDIIFHLGEYSRVEQSFEDVELVYKYNTIPFFNIIKLCLKHNSKLIYCGSSTKFAEYSKNDLISPYALSKINNVNFLNNLAKFYNINFAITYFYNVYGEGEIEVGKYATVVAKFINLYKKNELPLPINSPGTQTRNFTYIKDIINGLVLVGEKGFGDGYEIGSNESFSIIDLAEMIGAKYELGSLKPGNRIYSSMNITKMKNLGWEPKYYLKDYIDNKIMK
jgi:UDP-glucose 4-epimerase